VKKLTDKEQYLQELYDNLYHNFFLENKMKNKSLLISLLTVKSNTRFRAINSSSISNEKIPQSILYELKRNSFIKDSSEINKSTLTVKGIWEIEKKEYKFAEQTLLDFIEQKYFHFIASGRGLNDKERIILFAMICARTFSEKSPINLKPNEFILDAWKKIIDSCNIQLYKYRIIKKMSQEQLYGKKGNEHIISNLIRHTDSLPKKVRGIFTAPGKQNYYLNFDLNEKILLESLEFIIKTIFSKKEEFSFDEINDLNQFCKDIAYNEAPHIFDMKEHKFASYKYDDIIKEAMSNALFLI